MPNVCSRSVVEAVAVVHCVLRALVEYALAVLALDLLVLGLADVEDVVVAGAAVDPSAAEPDADRVVAGAAIDDVLAVAGVDPVLARAAVDRVGLALGVARRLVVAP